LKQLFVVLGAACLTAGCGTDLFGLPFDLALVEGPTLDSASARDGSGGGDLAGRDGGPAPIDLAGLEAGALLPASCALIGCTPTVNEGDVDLADTISGCHAYGTLTINGVVQVSPSDGLGFAACADHIIVGGVLSADGAGFAAGKGPGAGGSCGSGGGHGGAGADPGGCGGGTTYDDPNLPRLPGSGGGVLGGVGSGGAGGGAIELGAAHVDIIGFLYARGGNGVGAVSGGGAGGSILIHADMLSGGGQIAANGGDGFGLGNGGGGGGGRVALYTTASTATLNVQVEGGSSTTGPDGSAGTKVP
jgi:hypothetical protein